MLNQKEGKVPYLAILVIVILIVKLVSLALIPLMDTTEARYAEIARLMYETGNWITPLFDYNVPFWGKPPLFVWMSAASFHVFGVNEFAGRFPSYIVGILTIVLVGYCALKKRGFDFWLFAFILLITPEFLIHVGVISTDTYLNFSIALIMISFWKSMNTSEKTIWNYLIFVGFGIGLLAKGPIVMVLTVPPLFIWSICFSNWKNLLHRIPWLLGIPIMLIIAVPWYVLNEQYSKGFINYFIIGEHFNRFVHPGWKGDKYGEAHVHTMGMIWLYFTLFLFPWIFYVFRKIVNERKQLKANSWVVFLLCWLFWTPLFFSLSRNILHTYILPSAIPCALLVCYWMSLETARKWMKYTQVIPPLLCTALVMYLVFFNTFKPQISTDKYMVKYYTDYKIQHEDYSTPYLYWQYRSFSSRFYTSGCSKRIDTLTQFEEYFKQGKPLYIELPVKDGTRYNTKPLTPYLPHFKLIDSNYKRNLYLVTP